MQTEIEAKFLEIDTGKLRKRLISSGAKQEHKEILMRRKTFDDIKMSLAKIGGWIRVRDEGAKITFSYKQLNNRTLHGTKEISVDVDYFEKTCDLLESIGFKQKSYQETKREKWILNNVEITIDTWPWIPTLVELEAQNEDDLRKVARLLGFDWQEALYGSVETAYQKYFDVTEEEINTCKKIVFSPLPEWLEKKRKN